jgi:prefoldin subunit 5
MSELVKALSQRIDELEKENLSLKNKVEDLTMDNDQLQERILDLEACR